MNPDNTIVHFKVFILVCTSKLDQNTIMLVNHTKRRAVRCVLRVVCFAKCSFLAKNSENQVFQQQNHEIFKHFSEFLLNCFECFFCWKTFESFSTEIWFCFALIDFLGSPSNRSRSQLSKNMLICLLRPRNVVQTGGKRFFCENVAFEPPNLENVAFEPPVILQRD